MFVGGDFQSPRLLLLLLLLLQETIKLKPRDFSKKINYNLLGLKTATIEDPSQSTGASLFYFPEGATAQCDLRGGSAATSETSLLELGSMSCWIDGIVLAGGSTMGLAASDGVREALFKMRGDKAKNFDSIPSVPSAIVYDYGMRIHEGSSPLIYPTREMGLELMNNLSSDTFCVGRAGAGVTTTTNKISNRIWGGQGLDHQTTNQKFNNCNIVTAVVNNAVGNITLNQDQPIIPPIRNSKIKVESSQKSNIQVRENTTISTFITDLKLSNNELKRLAVQIHTSMASSIFPFHSFSDGDSLFAVSTQKVELPKDWNFDLFNDFSIECCLSMRKAIQIGVLTANLQN